jgi:hypothetical protein
MKDQIVDLQTISLHYEIQAAFRMTGVLEYKDLDLNAPVTFEGDMLRDSLRLAEASASKDRLRDSLVREAQRKRSSNHDHVVPMENKDPVQAKRRRRGT